jgi:hypothetical protein
MRQNNQIKQGTTIYIEATDKTEKHNSKLCAFGWGLDIQVEKPPKSKLKDTSTMYMQLKTTNFSFLLW